MQAIPDMEGTEIYLESTANGKANIPHVKARSVLFYRFKKNFAEVVSHSE